VVRGSWRKILGATAAAALILLPACFAAASGPVTSTFTAIPAPVPVPREGRLPVSLRLADAIETTSGSHPPVTTAARFELDKSLRLDMADVATCSPLQGRQVERGRSPCKVGKLAAGRLEAEVQFPEQGPVRVSGEATAYKTGSRKMLINAFLGAPVVGALLIPVKVGEVPGDRYGIKLIAAIPKLAGGSGSLTYLGLRFRKGLFSATCPDGSLQSSGANILADGTDSAGGSILRC
jgi:hypothetical protein